MTFIKKSVLPNQSGQSGKYLTTNGTTTSWATVSGGGISDGDKGDITVSSSGSVWTIDNLAVTDAKINDVAATKVTEDSTHRFVTDSQLTTINNTSGTNTGDETTASIQTKLGTSSTSTSGYLTSTDWNTFNNKSRLQFNNSTGSQSITANTVTYLTGSNITTANIKAGTTITWNISVTKTAAGTATPVFTVRFGTTSSTSDSTLLTFTGAAQTAAADTGMITIQCTFRTVGSGTSAVLAGHYSLVHQLDATGLSNGGGGAFATSAGFNSTTASAFLGVTVNSGASAAWTVNQVNVKIENIL